MTDEECLWEPVPGCWTVRYRGDTIYVADAAWPAPDPAPFTTVAWLLAHLTDCYGADRNDRFMGVPLEPAVLDPEGARPATVEAAVESSSGRMPAGAPT